MVSMKNLENYIVSLFEISILLVMIIVFCNMGEFGKYFCMFVEPIKILLEPPLDPATLITGVFITTLSAIAGFLGIKYLKRR